MQTNLADLYLRVKDEFDSVLVVRGEGHVHGTTWAPVNVIEHAIGYPLVTGRGRVVVGIHWVFIVVLYGQSPFLRQAQ